MTHKKRINEQCDSIHCAKKQDDDAQHEPKQSDLMRCGDLHLRIQDILKTSVRFDADTNKFNVQTVIACRNTQRQEEQVILSTIQRQATESLPQAGNDQTTNIRQYACKAKWDGL